MATVSELIKQANAQIDDTYDNLQYYTWFQEMLDDISFVLFLPKKVTVAKSELGGFPLPAGLKSIISVQSNGMTLGRTSIGSSSSIGYYILAGEIVVVGVVVATIEVFYDSTPDKLVQSPTYVPAIPLRYHRMFVLYSAKQATLLEDEVAYEDRYRPYQAEYLTAKAEMAKESEIEKSMSTRSSSTAWVVIR